MDNKIIYVIIIYYLSLELIEKKKGKRKDLMFFNYFVYWVIVIFYSCLFGFIRN